MYNKDKIDKATRQIITGYLRNYEAYKRWRNEKIEKLTFLKAHNIEMVASKYEYSDITGELAAKLEEIEINHKSKVVKAIEKARNEIGASVEMLQEQRETFRLSVWLSCIEPKKYTYEKLYARFLFPVSRMDFFRHKNRFLNNIKKYIEL